jgi:endonuclease/exonuclease/phosphatase family metal-dependent hydrolase
LITPRSPRLAALALAVAAAVPLTAPAAAPAQSRDLTVMTRNLYLGADLIPLAAAPNREAFEQAAAQRYQTVLRNDYATRVKPIAREIRRARPDLVGLQEAARWLRGPDGIKDGSTTPANQEIYDSTGVLLRELRALGARYRVVRARDWFDFEAPTALGFDVRLIQRDVILRRVGSRVRVRRSFAGGFRDIFSVPTQAGLASQRRGWVGADARVGGRSFRFVTTHLEAYNPAIGDQQARQLLGSGGPLASRRRQSILVGDLNSDPRTGQADDRGTDREPNAYRTVVAGGFRNPLPRRATCCFAEDLRSTSQRLDSWIDHILVRPRARLLRSSRTGAAQVGGMYPSDHAGIVARLRLR